MSNIQVPATVMAWQIGKDAANVQSWNNYKDNQGYSLLCLANNKYLTWQKVPIGINLNYVSEPSNKVHFRLPDNAEREILSGESVALGIGGGEAFLKYHTRDIGINLAWSQDPKFEWRIFAGEVGTPIPENTAVAIFNDKVEPEPDFLVFFNRLPAAGTDIGWTTSPGFWDNVGNLAEKHAADLAKAAIVALL
jgi:hypothetical protein